jgi:hypothetical protein
VLHGYESGLTAFKIWIFIGLISIHQNALFMGSVLTMPKSRSVHYFGDVEFPGGNPADPASGRARALAYKPSENVEFLLDWVKALRLGDWRACDVGTIGGERIADSSARVCEVASAVSWITEHHLMFQTAGAVLAEAGVSLAAVQFRDYELLKYRQGSFFAAHVDRLRGPGHLGTLVVVVATADAIGGELCLDDVPFGKDTPYLAFIPLGRMHSVTPVTAGTRYVAKAAVYGTTTADTEANKTHLYSKIRSD